MEISNKTFHPDLPNAIFWWVNEMRGLVYCTTWTFWKKFKIPKKLRKKIREYNKIFRVELCNIETYHFYYFIIINFLCFEYKFSRRGQKKPIHKIIIPFFSPIFFSDTARTILRQGDLLWFIHLKRQPRLRYIWTFTLENLFIRFGWQRQYT